MLLEVYAQSIDGTGFYSVYLALLLSMSISAFWFLNDNSFIESCLLSVKLKPSASETAFKNKADLDIRVHLLILKTIRIKIDPGDDDILFPSYTLLN